MERRKSNTIGKLTVTSSEVTLCLRLVMSVPHRIISSYALMYMHSILYSKPCNFLSNAFTLYICIYTAFLMSPVLSSKFTQNGFHCKLISLDCFQGICHCL